LPCEGIQRFSDSPAIPSSPHQVPGRLHRRLDYLLKTIRLDSKDCDRHYKANQSLHMQ